MSYATKVPPIDTCPDLLIGVQAALDKQIQRNLLLQEENQRLKAALREARKPYGHS